MAKFSLSIASLLLAIVHISVAETSIRITNGEWQPYLSEYSYQYGASSHIVTEAFKYEGIDVKWGFFPWARSYKKAAIADDWDASCCWWPTNDTHHEFLVSETVSPTSFVFFHLKGFVFDWEKMSDLQHLKIGLTRGYDYGRAFMDLMERGILKPNIVASDEQNFQLLSHGRIDIFPNDPTVGYAQIRNIFPKDHKKLFSHHPKSFEKSTLHLIISKNTKDSETLLRKFNRGLKKLKSNGRFKEILESLDSGKYDKNQKKWMANER